MLSVVDFNMIGSPDRIKMTKAVRLPEPAGDVALNGLPRKPYRIRLIR